MGDALREAYADLFTIKANPTDADRPLIEGKFKSVHNTSPNIAKLMASTFFALRELADLSQPSSAESKDVINKPEKKEEKQSETQRKPTLEVPLPNDGVKPSLHYNIQVHLPATKDVEVYNAIFKSLKEHLLE